MRGGMGVSSASWGGCRCVVISGVCGRMCVLGSAVATFALVLPSLILMILISKMFMKYMHHHSVESVFQGLRPAVVGLLAAATLLLCTADNFSTPTTDWWQFMVSCLLFIAAFIGVMFIKINPIRMILYCAIAGLVLFY